MSPSPLPAAQVTSLIRARHSPGVKLLITAALALFMSLMGLFIFAIVADRSNRAAEVKSGIEALSGGKTTIVGPLIVVPYTWTEAAGGVPKTDIAIIEPDKGSVRVHAQVEKRRRSLFTVPVFQADATLHADFDGDLVQRAQQSVVSGATLDVSRAQVVFAVSSAHALLADPLMAVDGQRVPLRSSDVITTEGLSFFATPAAHMMAPASAFATEVSLKTSGAEEIRMVPFAAATTLHAEGNWQDTGYGGAYLTAQHTSNAQGFIADWFVPSVARAGSDVMNTAGLNGAVRDSVVVSFTETADPYQSTTRALKYAPLFLGLVFLTYFLFEVTSAVQLHPAQYIMIGAAQLVFFLLLLSFAERIGFDLSFLISAAATVVLISLYAGWSFRSAKQRNRAAVIFTIVYAFIYTLLRMEDNALLIGSLVAFCAIAGLMYGTRNLQWFSGEAKSG